MVQPMLNDVELQLVQKIVVDENQVFDLHNIPALEGDFFQALGRRISRVTLTGILTGTEAGAGLKTLREKFRAAEPIPFVADIATATKVDQVMIETMHIRELAGKPERFEYALTLREFIPPSSPEEVRETQPAETQADIQGSEQVDEQVQALAVEDTAEQVNNIVNETAVLEVQVNLEDGADFSGIRVTLEGTTTDGEPFFAWSREQTNGLYRFENLQAGDYTVRLEVQ